jgi:hypothetical protein
MDGWGGGGQVDPLAHSRRGNPQARAEKVIVVGDHSVGKTSLVRRFCEGTCLPFFQSARVLGRRGDALCVGCVCVWD